MSSIASARAGTSAVRWLTLSGSRAITMRPSSRGHIRSREERRDLPQTYCRMPV